MSRANMQQTNVISDSSINNLLDVKKLGEQLSQDNANKIALLKQAVIDINEGLKESYQNGSDVNDIVYGRSYLRSHRKIPHDVMGYKTRDWA